MRIFKNGAIITLICTAFAVPSLSVFADDNGSLSASSKVGTSVQDDSLILKGDSHLS